MASPFYPRFPISVDDCIDLFIDVIYFLCQTFMTTETKVKNGECDRTFYILEKIDKLKEITLISKLLMYNAIKA